MKTHILTLTLSFIFCLTARAELKWEQTAVELHPARGDKQAIGHYKYQNVGKTPVHFKSVHASCGCTAAQSQKDQVGPGEKGEITATFNIGDRTGTQIKTVTVETDEAANQKTVLTLKAIIPQELEISPTFVFWKQGEKPDPKTITVHAGKDFSVKNIKVTSSSPDFQTKVQETGEGQFKIDVHPNETNRLLASTLTIQSENSPKTFYATARITTAPTAPGAPTIQKAGAQVPRSVRLPRLVRLRRLVKPIEIFASTPSSYSWSVVACSWGRAGDLFSRQDLVAITNSAFGNGERRSGARVGGYYCLDRRSPRRRVRS